MASNSDESHSAGAQLADFRIKNLNAGDDTSDFVSALPSLPVSAHGVIRGLPKSRYDSLVQDNPLAALSYIDEDDGEMITVGSSLELDQRLKEPFNPALAPRPPFGASSVHPDDVQLLHTFDLSSRDRQAIQLWRTLQASRLATVTARSPSTVPIWAQAKVSDAKGKTPDMGNFELDRFLHWASDQPHITNASSSRETSSPQKRACNNSLCDGTCLTCAGHGVGQLSQDAENNIMARNAEAADISNTVHTTSAHPADEAQHKPLLELFEAELAKLLPEKESALESESRGAQPTTAATIDGAGAQSTGPDASTTFTQTAGPASPAELLANTLSSLLSGLGNFAARVDEANPQIREQLAQAHAAGQGAAFNFLSRLIPEIQSRAVASGIREEPAPSSATFNRSEMPKATVVEARPRTQTQTNSPSTSSHRARTYEAERILASRYICYDNSNFAGPQYRQYLVRWAGCGPADDVWYDEDNLKTSCQPLIDMYERTRGHTLIEPQEAAQLHRRTAGNRMMASMVPHEQDLATHDELSHDLNRPSQPPTTDQFERLHTRSPLDGILQSKTPVDLETQLLQDHVDISDAERESNRNSYIFDPHHIMTQRTPTNAGRELETPLRRARSLAFRNVPSVTFSQNGNPDAQASDPAATSAACNKTFPSLRRAATTIHRHVDSRSRGLGAAETLFNNFEASRGHYLPRRAATTRSAYRNGGRRAEASPLSDHVMRCVEDLVKMGYRRGEAEPVAVICDGDVSKALDQLEEDRKAWLWRSSNETQNASGDATGGSMPGSWDIYRW